MLRLDTFAVRERLAAALAGVAQPHELELISAAMAQYQRFMT